MTEARERFFHGVLPRLRCVLSSLQTGNDASTISEVLLCPCFGAHLKSFTSLPIGAEKVMPALGLNAVAMPEPGQALTHEEVRELDVKPGHGGKRRIRNGNTKHLLIATVRVTL